jgi:glycosyltransferase involved in cell wall biosynthesis
MPDAAVLCALGPKFYGARVVLDIHDTMPELYQDKFKGIRGAFGRRLLMAEERASAWFADRVVAVHEPHRERLVRAGVPASKLSVVMNLPDSQLFGGFSAAEERLDSTTSIAVGNSKAPSASPMPGSNGAAVDPEGFRLVCHGTVTVRLGLDLAVHAVARLRKRIPSIHLHIIGEGDFLPAVKKLTEELALQPHVTFTPSVAVEQLPRALAPAAVGIVPNRASRATHLMLPAKLLEYAALGIPVIASRLYTMEYYFPPSTVRYFEPGNVEGLASAIEDLYHHPEDRERLRRNAAQVTANLSWERQRSQLFNTVDSLLAGDRMSAQRHDEFRPIAKIGRASQAGE